MAQEKLQTYNNLLLGFPNNDQKLIAPQNSRELVEATAPMYFGMSSTNRGTIADIPTGTSIVISDSLLSGGGGGGGVYKGSAAEFNRTNGSAEYLAEYSPEGTSFAIVTARILLQGATPWASSPNEEAHPHGLTLSLDAVYAGAPQILQKVNGDPLSYRRAVLTARFQGAINQGAKFRMTVRNEGPGGSDMLTPHLWHVSLNIVALGGYRVATESWG